MNQQQHTHRLRTLSRSYRAVLVNFTGKIFALDSAAVKTKQKC